MSDKRRIAIGFHAGGALPLKLSQEKLDELRKAVTGDGSGWHELETDDGSVLLNLGQVIYLRVEKDEQRVGF